MNKTNQKSNRVPFRNLLKILIVVIAATYLMYGFNTITYAFVNQQEPNVYLVIDNNGQVSCTGNLFGKELWYPGKSDSGVIRITNNYKNIKVTELGLDVALTEFKPQYDYEQVSSSFLEQMRLSITKGVLMVFTNTLIDNLSFSQLTSHEGNTPAVLGTFDQISLNKDESVDLKYSLSMDGAAGEELESVSASMQLKIGFDE